ncbi:MAG: hypothetical protein ABEK75_08045 [Salinibacter sp.]
MKRALRAADVTPRRMQRAVQEAQRAAHNGQSTLEWIRAVQGRAYSEDIAEKVLVKARTRLQNEFGTDDSDLQSPPSPEQIFAFLLAWEELGGSSYLAALKELQRRAKGTPSTN